MIILHIQGKIATSQSVARSRWQVGRGELMPNQKEILENFDAVEVPGVKRSLVKMNLITMLVYRMVRLMSDWPLPP